MVSALNFFPHPMLLSSRHARLRLSGKQLLVVEREGFWVREKSAEVDPSLPSPYHSARKIARIQGSVEIVTRVTVDAVEGL